MQSINLKELPIYYVNLESDAQRRVNFLRWTKKREFQIPVRIPGIKAAEYHVGLAEAQYNAVKIGIESGGPFIVMEDDATPNYENESYVIEVPNDADAVYLGASPYAVDKNNPESAVKQAEFDKIGKGLYRVKNALSAHAILYLTDRYALAALNELRLSFSSYPRHLDLAFAENLLPRYNVYFIKPLFYQNDIRKPYVTEITRDIDPNNFLIREPQSD
jgi:hypothetical protein